MEEEDIAIQLINNLPGDHYWLDKSAAVVTIAAALRAYGDARAQAERERCAEVAATYHYPQGPADDEHRGAYIMRDYIAAALRAYGDERARAATWQPSPARPADWDTAYPVVLRGKTLEAMQYLARFVLDQTKDPPFGAIGAADHLFCLAAAIRATPGERDG
jgi:hypothetical protein